MDSPKEGRGVNHTYLKGQFHRLHLNQNLFFSLFKGKKRRKTETKLFVPCPAEKQFCPFMENKIADFFLNLTPKDINDRQNCVGFF